MSSSRRLKLTYLVLSVWIGLAIFAILLKADLYALAVYFTSGLPIILGYLWAETTRPSLKEASEIVKNIKGNSYTEPTQQSYSPIQYNNNQIEINSVISIYSDDASIELNIDNSQLETLLNIGYVNSTGNKYTFRKELLEQIKSLINDNIQDPNI